MSMMAPLGVKSLWPAIRWKLVMLGVPSLAISVLISYIIWRRHLHHHQRHDDDHPPEPEAFPTETGPENDQDLTEEEEECLLDSPSSPSLQQVVTSTAVSPSDSGYVEQTTSVLKEESNGAEPVTSSPPPTASSPSAKMQSDTATVRGGRVRATVQLPLDIVGRFIGRQGRNIKSLMSESGSQIHVQQKNLGKDASFVPCIIQGSQQQIINALDLITLRHPEVLPLPYPTTSLSNYIKTSEVQSDKTVTSWDYVIKPIATPVVMFLAIVTYIEKLHRVWLVPYTSTHLLEELHQSMSMWYGCSKEDNGKVSVDDIFNKFCAVRVSNEYWLRGIVSRVIEDGNSCEIKLIDYGSSVIVSASSVKPLRKEHTSLPMQAFPCHLANIQPINTDNEDGMLVLQALVESTVLEVHPTGTIASPTDSTMVPLVELYIPSQYGTNGQAFINRELVNQGFALWKELTNDIPTKLVKTPPCLATDDALLATDTPDISNVDVSSSLSHLMMLSKESNSPTSKSLLPENTVLLNLLSNVTTPTRGGVSAPPTSFHE